MMKILCTIIALCFALTMMGCEVEPVPRQPVESQSGVVQEPFALPEDAPQTQDYYNQGNPYYQQPGMAYPQQQGMVYPQQQGMVYQQPNMAYQQQQLPVSQEPIELPLGVEPRPGMEIIQEPGQEPRLVYPDGTSPQGQMYPQPQAGYAPPVYSGPPAGGYQQQNIQEMPGTQGMEPGVIYQQGANGQLVPVTPQSGDPNMTYQQGYPQQGYPQYPQGTGQPNVVYPPGYAPQQGGTYPQQYGQPQVYYPPQQGATMQKRDTSQGQISPQSGGENIGYFSQTYGAPQGMYGRPTYYPPAAQNNTGVAYPPNNNQTGAN
jgi:hypothetical protein